MEYCGLLCEDACCEYVSADVADTLGCCYSSSHQRVSFFFGLSCNILHVFDSVCDSSTPVNTLFGAPLQQQATRDSGSGEVGADWVVANVDSDM